MDMRKRTALLFVAVALFAPAGEAGQAQHVILVSIDGFAAYHLLNQELLLPNIRELIAQGVSAASSETVFPSVTHPSHTTIVTGVEPRLHGVLGNRMVNRRTGEEFHPTNKPRREIVQVATLFDAAKAGKLTTASFFWPETRDDPAIDFNIPEVFTGTERADAAAVKPDFLAELKAAGIPIDLYFRWYGEERHGAADAILAEAAGYILQKHRPNLIAIHLLVTDKAQHEYGPHHYMAQAALTTADHCVGLLRQAVYDSGLRDRTAFIIAADHGFHSVSHEINVRPLFEKAGLMQKIRLHGSGWMLAVELTGRFQHDADMPALQKVFDQLQASNVVQRIAGPEDMHALGLPRYHESDYVRGQYLLIPDIDTYLVNDVASSSTERHPRKTKSHSHGYLPQHPRMYAALVLSGAGIRRGATLGHVRNIDIAPTVAHLLGFDMPTVRGRVLREALIE
jgi:predicted AlkP superfamily pyrophosphatase or phosphodiesterase